MDVLTTYLTDSEVAPLNKKFIEIESPKCTAIGFSADDRASSAEMGCMLQGVPYALLETIDGEVKAALIEIADEADGIDIERMAAVIKRDRRKLLATAESSLTDVLADAVVSGE